MADAPTTVPAAEDAVLPATPEPTPALAPGEADEWIAKLADAQIDALLNDAPPAERVEAEAAVTDEPPPAFPASFSPPGARPPALDAQALMKEMNAVPDEPVRFHAKPLPPPEPEPLAAIAPPPPPAEAEPISADAAAVAAELAADVHLSPRAAPAPAADESALPEARDPSHAVPAVEPKAEVEHKPARDWLAPLRVAADAVNAPSRALSDGQIETVGAVAIVTLANATALLFYLLLFRA